MTKDKSGAEWRQNHMKRVFFQNREEGAKLLADRLLWLRRRKQEETSDSPLVILAIPPGGARHGTY
jgi:hypothetical protein